MRLGTPRELKENDISVRAYPALTEAAAIIGVSPSTLSRRHPEFEVAGGRDKRLRPRIVLENAAYDRRRPLRDVANDLVVYAQTHAPEAEPAVTLEVEKALEGLRVPNRLTVEELLADLRTQVPPELYARIERVFQLEDLPRIPSMIGAQARRQTGGQVRQQART